MKKILFTIVASLIFIVGFSSNWVPLGSDTPVPAKVRLVSSNIQTSTLHFSLQGFEMIPISTPRGTSFVIGVGEASPMLVAGAPDLGKLTASIIIPDLEKMEVKVVYSNYKDFTDIDVAPSKGNFYRNTDPATVPFTWGKVYNENKFYPENISELREPYIIRDYRGETVIVYPFQYNPVTKTLRVYTDIEVSVYSTGEQGVNPLFRKGNLTKVNAEFHEIYQKHFLNAGNSRYNPVDEQGKMLIISYGSFMSAMQPLVDWKNQQGIPTEMVNVADVGSTAAVIKSYILNYYNNNDLAFVLLVGDGPQIPTNSGGNLGGPSDNAYGYLVGNDHYPDLFVGRFSAENVAQVQTQVTRTLNYEKTPLTTVDWFSKGVGIGSDQGPGDDNEYDYQHIRNIRTKLLNYTYTAVAELYDGTQGGLDAPGNPTTAMVASALNAGAGIINYTGHGSQTSWGTTGFSNSNVTALTNDNMLPFIWSVACVNGDFVSGTCFAEAWLRATHNGQPSGAVATLMSTINQSWNPPMCGEDAMDDILVETFANNIKRTFGGISMNGCMQMNDEYGVDGNEMTDTWNCFGDPSLMVRTAMPQAINASHPPTIFLGAAQFSVNADAEGALVSLTINNQIIATGTVSGGIANLSFEPLAALDTMKVTITAYNHLFYESDVPIIPAQGPYVTYYSHTINDMYGNNNGLADFGESILLTVGLKNVGVESAYDVIATLGSTDAWVTIVDANENYGLIPAGAIVAFPDGFSVIVSNSVPDGHSILFSLNITDGANTWTSSFSVPVNAPLLSVGTMTISDPTGNGNGRLDPGETVDVMITSSNTGHSDALNTLGSITTTSPYLTLNSASYNFNTLTVGQTATATFNLTASSDAPVGSVADINYLVASGEYNASKVFISKIGIVLEDFESGGFNQFPWTQGGNQPWTISNVEPYEGVYSAKSGTITHSQKSDLSLQMDITNPDSISFYLKTSSESGYDYLKFFIDATSVGQWAGETPWTRVSFPVTAGNHTFKWEYMKDGSVSSGSDCSWIDYVVFPAAAPGAASVTGAVTYANTANTALSGLILNLKNAGGTVVGTTTTNATGNYTFNAVAPGSYTLEVTTTKAWGGVSAADVLLYRKHIANISLLTGIYLTSGDVNGSGSLSAADVLLIKKRIGSITNSFPVGDWLFNNMPFTMGSVSVTQNFKGIVYGDANGSYIPTGIKSLVPNYQGTITLEPVVAEKGEITVPVVISEMTNLGSFQFTVQYDPSKLTPEEITGWYQGIDGVTTGMPAPGLITFVWAADVAGVSINNGILCNLHFTSASAEGSGLEFISAPTQQEFSDYEGVIFEPEMINGAVKSATGTGENDLGGLSVYPNPSDGKFTLRFANGKESVHIRIMNAIGNVVYEAAYVPAGRAKTIDLSAQPKGIYMIRVEDANQTITRKIVIGK
ncbi:MAG: C25 family cysteine peptidase [Bacteroidota bacterium]